MHVPHAVITYNPEFGEDLGPLGRWLEARDFTVTLVPRTEPVDPDVADGADLLIVLGSHWSVARPMDRPDDDPRAAAAIDAELELVRRRLDADEPMLGICFGAQMMCRVLGGEVDHLQNGLFMDWHAADGDVAEISPPWFYIHEDHMRLPPGAETLAEADHATIAFRYGRSWGIQFHPEADAEVLQAWFDFLDMEPERAEPLVAYAAERAEVNERHSFALLDRMWAELQSPA